MVVAPSICWLNFENEKNMDTPTIKRKNGNTISVGVAPSQAAWRKGGKTCDQDPGVFTKIINATVSPLKASSASSLLVCIEDSKV